MINETLERIRLTAKVSQAEWCDLLKIHWIDYQDFRAGRAPIEEKALEAVAQHFQFSFSDLTTGRLDFVDLAIQTEEKGAALPLRYSQAAFGRRRSSITAVQFIEDKIGWRLRNDVLQRFSVPESELLNPFAPVSVLFITDLCAYLHKRGMRSPQFRSMGAYNYDMTSHSLIGRHFSEQRSVQDIYESFFLESINLFEANCTYTLQKLTATGGVFEVRSVTEVARELGVQHVGSPEVCAFKSGHAASLPRYLGLPMAAIRETACVHKGDSCCRFEFEFQERSSLKTA